jgi:hypothetical protein
MRKQTANVWSVFLATALVMVGGASVARADDERIVARVPFAFMVGESRMPAGDYLVREMSDDPSVVSIASADGRQFAYTLTIPSSARVLEPPAQPELVFEKLDNQYFLARVVPAGGMEREIVLTHARTDREHAAVNP